MSRTPFCIFSSNTVWRRPVSIRAWQSEIDNLEKAGVTLYDIENDGGVGSWAMLAGLLTGMLVITGMALRYSDTISFIAVGLCLFFTLVLGGVSIVSALGARKERVSILNNPARQRLTALQEPRAKRWAAEFRKIPNAYAEFLEASQGPVPLLVGDIESIRQKYAVADPEGGITGGALCFMVSFMCLTMFGLFIISAAHLH